MDLDARLKFEKRIDEAAKKAVRFILKDGDPGAARTQLRALLRKVAIEATKQPDMFDPVKEK